MFPRGMKIEFYCPVSRPFRRSLLFHFIFVDFEKGTIINDVFMLN